MGPSARLHLRLLGRFAVASDAEFSAPVRLATKKVTALVACLAMSPDQAVSREELAALLWGSCSDQQARHSLRQALVSLRKQLSCPDAIAAEPDLIRLQPGAWWVDALCFEELSRSTRIEDLAAAARLFRGDLLGGFRLDQEGFEDWLRHQRHRMQTAAIRLCETFLEPPDAAPSGDEAIAVVEQLLAIEPLREDWQRLALRLYARCRGKHAALAQAKVFEAVLRRELDVDPEQATQALVDDIRRGVLAPPPAIAVHGAVQPAPDGSDASPISSEHSTLSPAPERAQARTPPRFAPSLVLTGAIAAVAILGASASFVLGLHTRIMSPGHDERSTDNASIESTIERLVSAGNAAHRRGNTVEALGFHEEALRRRPDHIPALIGVSSQLINGVSNFLLERTPSLDRAEQLLNRALQIDPESASAHHWLGIITRDYRRDYESALRLFARALELNPNSTSSHAQTGRTLAKMGRLEEAMTHIHHAMRVNPTSPTMSYWLMFAGETELELGRHDAALNSLQRALELAPRNPRLHAALAATFAMKGDAASAARHAAEFEHQSHPRSFAGLMDNIKEDAKDRTRAQPRLVEGLRLAFGLTDADGLPLKGMTWRRFTPAGR